MKWMKIQAGQYISTCGWFTAVKTDFGWLLCDGEYPFEVQEIGYFETFRAARARAENLARSDT